MGVTLGTTCTACETDRKRKGIRYHPETFEPFCENPYGCTPEHPNSPKNVAERAERYGKDFAVLEMLPYAEASEKFADWLHDRYAPDESERIRRMTTKPITFRAGDVDTAVFLLHTQEERGFRSVSDVVRFCIEYTKSAMTGELLPIPKLQQTEDEPEPEQQPEPAKESWTF